MRLVRVSTLIAAVLLTVPACTGPLSEPPAEEKPKAEVQYSPLPGGEPALDPAIVAAADPGGTGRPLDAFGNASDSVRQVSRARMIVGDRCMRAFGFEPDPAWVPEGADSRIHWDRYGLWDARAAATRGYEAPQAPSRNPSPVRFLSPEAISVYLGEITEYRGQKVPAGGCQGEEYRALMRDVPATLDQDYLEKLDREALTRSQQDSRVAKLLTAWQQCMKASGWDYTAVRQPFEEWATNRGRDQRNPVVSDEELRSARDDLACKQETKLLGTWLAADVAYQKVIVERESTGLREYQRVGDTMLANANRIIAEG